MFVWLEDIREDFKKKKKKKVDICQLGFYPPPPILKKVDKKSKSLKKVCLK